MRSEISIRKATLEDIPSIVALLKLSLGDSLIPKSEAYWRWKHVDNPFGPSPVVVSEHNNEIVGVRAFMRWQWQRAGHTINAVRAVDTATHPAYQGQGIFRNLTLHLLKECKQEGVEIVFNTPNSKSLSGYLKMGWEKAGRMPVMINFLRPVNIAKQLMGWGDAPSNADPEVWQVVDDPTFPDLVAAHRLIFKHTIQSTHTHETVRWRYATVPVARYGAIPIAMGSTLVASAFFRIKPSSFGTEFRVTDVFVKDPKFRNALAKRINEMARNFGADYITNSYKAAFHGGVLSIPMKGPIVTVKQLNVESLNPFVNFTEWAPSLGDLELF